jgi:hypothetical protein
MSFENLPQAISVTEALAPPTADTVAFADEQLTDEVALGIVLADTEIAEKYLLSRGLITALDSADDLYRANVKPRMWANGKARSNLGMPVVLEAIEKILPTLYMSIFGSGKEPFAITPTGKTTPGAARAKGKILQWAIKQSGLKEGMRLSLKNCLQYGFCVGNWGWESKESYVKNYALDAHGKVKGKKEVVTINVPTYESMDMRQLLWDPACKVQNLRDPRAGAKYVIKQVFVDANWLDEHRDDPTYKNIPTRDELAVILANNRATATDSMKASKTNVWRDLQAQPSDEPSTSDPLKQPLELLEYWSNDRVIVALQRTIVIRNEESEFTTLPFPSCAFIDVLGSAVGFGVAKLLAGEQRFQIGVLNTWVDSLALTLNPIYQLTKGMGAGTQQITLSPGKVLNETGELKPLITPSVSAEANNAIQSSEQRAAKRVGSQGGSDMPTQALRTASGIQSYQGNTAERLQYMLEIFTDMVFVPVLEAFLEMCADHLTKEQVQQILSEADGKAYEGDILQVYNATVNVAVLAATKLAARQAAAQLVPQIIALVTQQPVQDSLQLQGMKFDYAELLDEALELQGWDIGSLIVPMDAADQARVQQQNAALIKAQAASQQEQQQHQNDLDLVNERGTVQAGVAIVRQLAKSHADEAQSVLDKMSNPTGNTNG